MATATATNQGGVATASASVPPGSTAVASASADGNTANASVVVLATAETAKKVWCFMDAVCRKVGDDGKQFWQCNFCNSSFKSWNATKAIYHIAKLPGESSAMRCNCPCSAVV